MPPGNSTVVKGEDVISVEATRRPISTIVFIIAMHPEALPIVNKFNLLEDPDSMYLHGQVLDLYGISSQPVLTTPNLLNELNLKDGKLSTGDSLDMCPQDEALIISSDAIIKDMEGAAIAYVADLLKVPIIFLKAVTDVIDGEKPTTEEFLQNLAAVTAALEQSI